MHAHTPHRILALDVGAKRIGVAVSDPLGITAQGLDTIQRQNKRRDYEAIAAVLTKYEVKEVIVGLPLRLSGAEGTQSEKMRRFADDLHAKFALPVHRLKPTACSAKPTFPSRNEGKPSIAWPLY